MKRKSHSRRYKTTLYLRLKVAEHFHTNEIIKLQLVCELGFYFGGVAKSHARAARVRRRERERRGERRVLSQLASLAINGELSSRLNFNSCLVRY